MIIKTRRLTVCDETKGYVDFLTSICGAHFSMGNASGYLAVFFQTTQVPSFNFMSDGRKQLIMEGRDWFLFDPESGAFVGKVKLTERC